jgi:LemA protein
MTSSIVALSIAAALLIVVILIYNSLIRARMRVRTGWAQIDAQLRRRHDLIPNIVGSVRGYFAHEADVLERVTALRESAAVAGDDVAKRAGAEAALSGALGKLIARVEAMPDLKANTTVLALQEELTTTENRIAFARQHYNETAGEYNAAIATIPNVLIAAPCGFKPAASFEIDVPIVVPVVSLERAA